MNIKLNDRNEEIFKDIPNRQNIINSILTRSIENGSFMKELSFFLSSSKVEDIISKIEIPDIEIKKRPSFYSKTKRNSSVRKEIDQAKKEEVKSTGLFSGFDG